MHEWVEENEDYVEVSEESAPAESGAQGGVPRREAMVSRSCRRSLPGQHEDTETVH